MYQTLVGIGMIVVGSAIIIFSELIARVTAALHRRTLGIELPRGWKRGGVCLITSNEGYELMKPAGCFAAESDPVIERPTPFHSAPLVD